MDWGESEMGEIKIFDEQKVMSECVLHFVWVLSVLILL